MEKRKVIRLDSFALCMLLALAFLYRAVVELFSTGVYLTLVVLALLLYAAAKPIKLNKFRAPALWLLPAAAVAIISYMRSKRLVNSTMDVMVLVSCMTLCFFYSLRLENYRKGMKLMVGFAVFYALGVLLQKLAPILYEAVLLLFPSAIKKNLKVGFSGNGAFSAAYIVSGIIASLALADGRRKPRKWILPAFLFFALLYTGKRGHVLFMVLALLLCYLLPVRGVKKFKRYWYIFIALLAVLAVMLALGDFLARIPFVGEIVETVNGVLAGEDVTSSRSSLFAWAWLLFLRNPLLGIGWGNFRTTTAGNATYSAELDTHNIYLQLLCETGIIGFVFFILVFILFWRAAQKDYCTLMRTPEGQASPWRKALYFSLLYQSFFLLYGLTGNPLYDQHNQIMYLFACSIVMAYRYLNRRRIN